MRRSLHLLAFAALAALALPVARAQAVVDVRATCDTIGIVACQTTPRTVFRADDSGSLVAPTELGVGAIPATGAGYRMMWYGFKAAFRIGGVTIGDPTAWDDANVGFYSFASGNGSRATAFASFAHGDAVEVTGVDATGFGGSNIVAGTAGFSAGASNHCYGFACVAIGFTARTAGQGAIAIGYRTTADADYAVAIGHRASANGHSGTFTWADESTADSLENSADNSFQTRAAGGYRLYTNATATVGARLDAGATTWNTISDRNAKEDFLTFDGEALLQRIAQMPLSTWHYRDTETTDRHIGPMAQDWQALVDGPLGLNADDLTINQGDFDGVNLAGIQALEARTRTLAEENAALRAELDALRAERTADAARFARLEAALARLAPAAGGTGTTMASATTDEEPRP